MLQSDFHTFDLGVSPALASATQIHTNSKITWIMHPGTDRAPTHNLEYLPGKEQNSYTKRNTTTKQPLYSRFPTREVLLIKITYYARAMHRHARARFTEGCDDSSLLQNNRR